MAFFRNLSMFLALFFTWVFIFIIPVTSQPQPQPQACKSYKFLNTTNFLACKDLLVLDSSLYWTYRSSSNSVDVAFKKNNADRKSWIAWAVNPTSAGMVGSQAFVAFQKSDGTMTAYTSPVTSYGTTLEERSPVSDDDSPLSHALSGPNLKSFGHIDFLTGKVSDHDASLQKSKILIRKVHGILNGIGWGIMMPTGAMMGRYLKAFEATGSTWFHLHRACQILAYIIGTAGFSLGIFLSNPSLSSLSPSGFVHASIGIAVFVSIFLGRQTSQARTFWNIFHYVIGYGVIVLSIINMFRGFSVSNTGRSWRNAYFCVIVSLGCVALTLEVITWFLACKRRNKKTMEEILLRTTLHPKRSYEPYITS
ncbi:hypothetical protein K1719_013330 [Acacia pycnantha]|nr:hypothetical protein K1719_013330 [Acacia pycnantha]